MNKYSINKILDKEIYIKYIKNKEFSKIDNKLNKLLRKIFSETVLLIENNTLEKEIEKFNTIKEKVLEYSEEIKYKPSIQYKIVNLIPFLDEIKEEIYLEGLRNDFNLEDIKIELVNLFSIVELTLIQLNEHIDNYKSYSNKLEDLLADLIDYEKIIEKEKEKEISETDTKYFENLYINLHQIKGDFKELKAILELYTRQLINLLTILDKGNKQFKKVFKEVIGVRSIVLSKTIKNKAAIIKDKQLEEKLETFENYFNNEESKLNSKLEKTADIYSKLDKYKINK